jgi:hypothetical protein
MAKVDFEFETKYGKFADAIWFPDDAPMSDADIEAEKQRRLTNWLAIIETPAPAEPEA